MPSRRREEEDEHWLVSVNGRQRRSVVITRDDDTHARHRGVACSNGALVLVLGGRRPRLVWWSMRAVAIRGMVDSEQQHTLGEGGW